MKHFVECMLVASESSTMLNRTIYIYANLLSFFLAELFLGQIEWQEMLPSLCQGAEHYMG